MAGKRDRREYMRGYNKRRPHDPNRAEYMRKYRREKRKALTLELRVWQIFRGEMRLCSELEARRTGADVDAALAAFDARSDASLTQEALMARVQERMGEVDRLKQ